MAAWLCGSLWISQHSLPSTQGVGVACCTAPWHRRGALGENCHPRAPLLPVAICIRVFVDSMQPSSSNGCFQSVYAVLCFKGEKVAFSPASPTSLHATNHEFNPDVITGLGGDGQDEPWVHTITTGRVGDQGSRPGRTWCASPVPSVLVSRYDTQRWYQNYRLPRIHPSFLSGTPVKMSTYSIILRDVGVSPFHK